MTRAAFRWVLGACVLIASMLAVGARAEDEGKPRAAVIVTADPNVDPFLRIYVFEVAAGVLRERGFEVAPPNAAAARLAQIGKTPAECAADDACLRDLALRVRAPTIILANVSPGGERLVVLKVFPSTVRSDGIDRATPLDASVPEVELAGRLRGALAPVADGPTPCQVEVDAPDGLRVTVSIDRAGPIERFPAFIAAGRRTVRIAAPGRAPWTGPLECEAGAVYNLRVR